MELDGRAEAPFAGRVPGRGLVGSLIDAVTPYLDLVAPQPGALFGLFGSVAFTLVHGAVAFVLVRGSVSFVFVRGTVALTFVRGTVALVLLVGALAFVLVVEPVPLAFVRGAVAVLLVVGALAGLSGGAAKLLVEQLRAKRRRRERSAVRRRGERARILRGLPLGRGLARWRPPPLSARGIATAGK